MTELFTAVLNLSLTGSCVIVFVLLLRLLLKRAPKKFSYALWGVVGFRLCCPVSVKSSLSLFSLFSLGQSAGSSVPASLPEPVAGSAQAAGGISLAEPLISSSVPAPGVGDSVNPVDILLFLGAIVWCMGMAARLVYLFFSTWRLHRSLRGAALGEGGVYRSDRLSSPTLFGILRPRIYLPADLPPETTPHVLAHERFHKKHLDHLVKLLAWLILTVHWFNPLCHLAFFLMSRDMELRCDEGVLAQGVSPVDYSEALLSLASAKPAPLGFSGGAKGRIRNALGWKKPKAWCAVLAGVICLLGMFACAADPAAQEEETLYRSWETTYMSPYSFYYSPYGDSGQWYLVGADSFRAVDKKTGAETLSFEGLTWDWEDIPMTTLQWNDMFGGTGSHDPSGWTYLPLDASNWLLKKDGTLHFARLSTAKGGQEIFWSIYALAPVDTDSRPASWFDNPAQSSGFGGFPIWLDMTYTTVTAQCTAGQLQSAQILAGEPLCWQPADRSGNPVEKTNLTFQVYNGTVEIASGVIEIQCTQADTLTRTYEASLTTGENLVLYPCDSGALLWEARSSSEGLAQYPEVTLELPDSLPNPVAAFAKDYVTEQMYRMTGLRFAEARITGCTAYNTGTANETVNALLYRLAYRLLPENPAEARAAGCPMEGDWITEETPQGQPCLLLVRHLDTGSWECLAVLGTDTIRRTYGTPEYLEQYDSPEQAAVMEHLSGMMP